jgi:hypothetical protein
MDQKVEGESFHLWALRDCHLLLIRECLLVKTLVKRKTRQEEVSKCQKNSCSDHLDISVPVATRRATVSVDRIM